MNAIYTVLWSESAESDLTALVEYIAIENPHRALKVLQRIKEKTATLYHAPQRGRIVPELQAQGVQQYRELILDYWRVIYRIMDTHVYVLSVLDSRQNVEDLLLKKIFLTQREK